MKTPTFSHRWLAGAFLTVIAGLALWSTLRGVAPTEVALIPCPIRSVTDTICPGCGITRASVALARGDLQTAWTLHPFAYLLVPLALAFFLAPVRTRLLWRAIPKPKRKLAVLACIAAVLVLWGIRLSE